MPAKRIVTLLETNHTEILQRPDQHEAWEEAGDERMTFHDHTEGT